MADLFRRSWKVTIDTIDASNLDIEFKILATTKPEPNKCTLVVWNMNRETRQIIEKRNRPNQQTGVRIVVEAGYVNFTAKLFEGDMRNAVSQRDGVDWKTTITADDGGRSWRESAISQTFTKGTPISTVLEKVATALGVGRGNIADFESQAQIAGVGSTLPAQMVMSGQASRELDRLMRSIGFVWSIQNGALQVQQKGQPLNATAIRLTSDTGLIGSPEAAIDATVSLGNPQQVIAGKSTPHKPKAKDPGILRLRSFLIPGLRPGVQIDLESAAYKGTYMLPECEYRGQSWSREWYCDMIARVFHG